MPDSSFYESAHVALDSVRRAKGSISSEYDNDNTTRMYMEKCLEAIEYGRDHNQTMSVGNNTPVYLQHFGSPREELLDKVFKEAESFTSHSPTTSTDSQGGSNGRQTNTLPPSSLPSNDTQGITAPNKKRRGDDEEEWDGRVQKTHMGKTATEADALLAISIFSRKKYTARTIGLGRNMKHVLALDGRLCII
jgi:hypothetical protein